jgi:RNA polymerase sigma factor (sigma-70 family)
MVNGPSGSVLGPRGSLRPAPAEEPTDRELLQRFTADRDEDAFAALVYRYGPMVLGVCRRVLRNPEDAQDAFQVTFLVLARKADALEKPELLANWLYGVAYRTAVRARGRAARRRERERQAGAMPAHEAMPGPDGEELLAVLDEELNQLPERYRILLVLCYLEGMTHEQAARCLGYPLGSMAWRLERARAMLRKRLARRGLALATGLPTLLLFAHTAGAAALPARLAETTTQAILSYAAGASALAAGFSASAAALADEMLGLSSPTGWGVRALKPALAALLTLLAAGLLAYHVWGSGSEPGPSPEPTATGGCSCP